MSVRFRTTLAVVALIALVGVLHWDATGGWWLSDDPQVLLHAMTETPASVLFSPPAWRYLSASSFTPLVTLSFGLDLSVAGLNARFFYLHQLAAIAIAVALLFLLLKENERISGAWLCAACLAAAPATVLAARGLMVRHYVEGLVLALVALLLFRRALTESDVRLRGLFATAAALAYLLSMLAKEFYAPLPLFMIWQARARGVSWRLIAMKLLPSALAAVVYILWRSWMLGSGGGYGTAPDPKQIAALPLTLWHAMIGQGGTALAVAAAASAAIALAVSVRRNPKPAAGFLIAAGLFVFLPLAALASSFEPRYAFAATAVFVSAIALAVRGADDRRLLAVPLSLLIMFLAAGQAERRAIRHSSRAITAEGRYVWSMPGSAAPILASSPGWYLAGLESIRRLESGSAAPAFFLSTDAIVLSDLPPERFVRSVWGSGEIQPFDDALVRSIESSRAAFDPDAPLEVRLERRKNDIAWHVGPPGGTFSFITVPYYGRFPIGMRGGRRISEARERQFFRIRRDLPDGTWTVSPVFELPGGNGVVEWVRGKESVVSSQ